MKYKSKNSHKKSTLQTYRFRKKFFIFSASLAQDKLLKNHSFHHWYLMVRRLVSYHGSNDT